MRVTFEMIFLRCMMKQWKLLALGCALLALTGCASMDSTIQVDSDFSGKWEAQFHVPEPLSKTDIEGGFDDSVSKIIQERKHIGDDSFEEKQNKEKEALRQFSTKHIKVEPVDETGKILNYQADTKSEYWKITASFSDESELTNSYRIVYGAIDKPEALHVIYPYGEENNTYMFNMGRSYGTTTITIDGDIKTDFKTDGVVNGNTITFEKDQNIRFVFLKASHTVRNVLIGSVALGVVLGAYMIWRKRGQ